MTTDQNPQIEREELKLILKKHDGYREEGDLIVCSCGRAIVELWDGSHEDLHRNHVVDQIRFAGYRKTHDEDLERVRTLMERAETAAERAETSAMHAEQAAGSVRDPRKATP